MNYEGYLGRCYMVSRDVIWVDRTVGRATLGLYLWDALES